MVIEHVVSGLLERGFAEIRGVLTCGEIGVVQKTLPRGSAEGHAQYGNAQAACVTLRMLDRANMRPTMLRVPNDSRMRRVLSSDVAPATKRAVIR